jgi:hypothetical protein
MQVTDKNKSEKLSPKTEQLLDDIDSGKTKTTKYTADEYLKHVDKVTSEKD